MQKDKNKTKQTATEKLLWVEFLVVFNGIVSTFNKAQLENCHSCRSSATTIGTESKILLKRMIKKHIKQNPDRLNLN